MSIGRSARFRVLRDAGFRCHYCGRSEPDVKLEVDHVVPRSQGGSNDMDNLTAACFDCNRGKRAMPAYSESAPKSAPFALVEPLVGLYFHQTVDGGSHRQGKVIASVGGESYLVQWFEWVMGFASTQGILTLSDLSACAFYQDADDWRRAGDDFFKRPMPTRRQQA